MIPLGVNMPFFKHDMPEIRHVVVVLAGSNAASRDLERLQTACMVEDVVKPMGEYGRLVNVNCNLTE